MVESVERMEQFDYNLWKNHAILNDIDSKRSSSCFQSHNLRYRVTGFVDAFSHIFFPLDEFFFCQFKGDNLYTKIMQQKKSPCSFISLRSTYLFTWSIYWKTIPRSRNTRAYVNFMRSTGWAVPYQGITSKDTGKPLIIRLVS